LTHISSIFSSRVVGLLPFRDQVIVMVEYADGKRGFLEASEVRQNWPGLYMDFLESKLNFEPLNIQPSPTTKVSPEGSAASRSALLFAAAPP
jgi:hypothetical protein